MAKQDFLRLPALVSVSDGESAILGEPGQQQVDGWFVTFSGMTLKSVSTRVQ